MTPNERLEALVKYALEAFDKTTRDTGLDIEELARAGFEINVRERMAQAAQVWTNEIKEAVEHPDSHRISNIGAFFTRKG